MRYLFDTDTCIELIRHQPSALLARLDALKPGDVGLSAITAAELEFGVARSADPAKNRSALDRLFDLFPILPFDRGASGAYGAVRYLLEKAGHPIGPLDTLIAAHALQLDLTLVTHNTREFKRVRDLRVESWR